MISIIFKKLLSLPVSYDYDNWKIPRVGEVFLLKVERIKCNMPSSIHCIPSSSTQSLSPFLLSFFHYHFMRRSETPNTRGLKGNIAPGLASIPSLPPPPPQPNQVHYSSCCEESGYREENKRNHLSFSTLFGIACPILLLKTRKVRDDDTADDDDDDCGTV